MPGNQGQPHSGGAIRRVTDYVVNSQKIVAVVNPDAAPVKRMVQSVKGTNSLVDATQGRKTKSVIVTSDDILILSAIQPDTIARRFAEVHDFESKGEGHE